MRLILLILIAMFALACSTNPVVGKWKAVRTYDPVRKQLVPVAYEGHLEVSSDGTYRVILADGSKRTGEYKLDEAVTPHRFTATEKDGKTVKGIYWVENERMGIRIADVSARYEYPKAYIDQEEDNTGDLVVEFERKTE